MSDGSAFVDFVYPGEEIPCGVFQKSMPRPFKARIMSLARAFRDGYTEDGWKRWRWDCRIMAPAWLKVLGGLDAVLIEGEGVDFDHEGGPEAVPERLCTGYRKADGFVHCHYWLLIGARRHLFDPTAYQQQFEREGPIKLGNYVIEGVGLPAWRQAYLRSIRGCNAADLLHSEEAKTALVPTL